MFSARGVALNVTTASVQLRMLHNSVYLSARLKLRSTNSSFWVLVHTKKNLMQNSIVNPWLLSPVVVVVRGLYGLYCGRFYAHNLCMKSAKKFIGHRVGIFALSWLSKILLCWHPQHPAQNTRPPIQIWIKIYGRSRTATTCHSQRLWSVETLRAGK
jgi:hypothetical protein